MSPLLRKTMRAALVTRAPALMRHGRQVALAFDASLENGQITARTHLVELRSAAQARLVESSWRLRRGGWPGERPETSLEQAFELAAFQARSWAERPRRSAP